MRLISLLFFVFGCTKSSAYFASTDDLGSIVSSEIETASETVHIAIYTITYDPIAEAIANTASRSVEVTIYADYGQTTTLSNQNAILKDLSEKGVNVKICDPDGSGPGIIHHKFAVIDSNKVITGSFNYTEYATDRHRENIVVLTDPDIAQQFEDEFTTLDSDCVAFE